MAAIVEAAPGATIDTDQLVDSLRGSLAGFKVPRLVVLRPAERADA